MVKKIVFLLGIALSAWAQTPLLEKVSSLIGEQTYSRNEAFVKIIFADRSRFVQGDRIDVVKVVDTLKENGLLSLFYKRPKTLELTFETNGSPQFFMMLMNETLRGMGYTHYLTDSAMLTNAGYSWRIKMQSEYATDPTALQQALSRRGCGILDIERNSDTQWRYFIDMSAAHLELTPLEVGKKIRMKRLVYPRWLDVSKAGSLTLWSLSGNNWYPYIAFYDDDLRLLKLYKRDKRTRQITINLPRGCAYVKIADLYSRKNMNAGLSVKAQ
ncbi:MULTISPECIES: hypothetical protein [Sulfurimonas]|uniref:Periplasmic protein n=1 Tax=Sulfurimonas diazotrophicus TaxID=3131939 RepID=A0ABZ3HAY2_9BACT